jgi:hypothetical protein
MPDQARLETAHLDSIRRFARVEHVEEAIAIAIYEGERKRLSEGAKVAQYVSIRAEKRAKALIVRMRHERPASTASN